MTTPEQYPFDDLSVDHVRLYVGDLSRAEAWLASYGFQVFARSGTGGGGSIGLGRDHIRLVLTQPPAGDDPASAYLERHGDGVADIALRVPDATAAFTEAVRRGARPVRPPSRQDGVATATIVGFGDVTHTFVDRVTGTGERAVPGLHPVAAAHPVRDPGLSEVDHFAVCLEPGQLDPTVELYRTVLDFDMIFTEHIRVGAQAMCSKVVQSRSGAVTLTLIEPDPRHHPGQIDEFLKSHGGPGVQHIAFATDDIVRAVRLAGAGGVRFLDPPAAYYRLLGERLEPTRHSATDLREVGVLVDEDHYGQLFQIFARSVHPRQTFFLELIERQGARTFGSGNIKALYQAVEAERRGQSSGPG